MAHVMEDCRTFAAGCDLSGQSNKIELSAEGEEKDATTFRSGAWRECATGLLKAQVKASGFVEFLGPSGAGGAGSVDYDAFTRLGRRDPWSVGPDEADVGALVWFTDLLRGKYTTGGKPGDLAPWAAEGSSSWPLVRGVFMHPPGTARTADGNGTAVQVGALAAGQRLYAAAHVLSVAGSAPTIDLSIQSDSVEAFSGSPETRLTFAQRSTVGGEIVRTVAGAHADDWYRIQWNLDEGDSSFLFVVSLGIV